MIGSWFFVLNWGIFIFIYGLMFIYLEMVGIIILEWQFMNDKLMWFKGEVKEIGVLIVKFGGFWVEGLD